MKFLFGNPCRAIRMIVDHNHQLRKLLIAGTLAETVHRYMDAVDSRFDGGKAVRRHKPVVIVSVEIKTGIGKRGIHPVEITRHLIRRHNAERIGQHDPFQRHILESIHERIDIME